MLVVFILKRTPASEKVVAKKCKWADLQKSWVKVAEVVDSGLDAKGTLAVFWTSPLKVFPRCLWEIVCFLLFVWFSLSQHGGRKLFSIKLTTEMFWLDWGFVCGLFLWF